MNLFKAYYRLRKNQKGNCDRECKVLKLINIYLMRGNRNETLD